MKTLLKDPDARLDYKFDWSEWLEDTESINSVVVTVGSGLSEVTASRVQAATSVTVWLEGGTVLQSYNVACRITTNSTPPRTDERTLQIIVRDR